ncbi:hypothetical protein MMC29_000440 [Sticta canariensis]|nr:hypothetical protein [Sticta canariensis]
MGQVRHQQKTPLPIAGVRPRWGLDGQDRTRSHSQGVWGLFRVDVLDPYGTLLRRIVATFLVTNFVLAGPDNKQLWLVDRVE